ncbi:MAG: acetate--CoA ligase family protein [Bacillota bacterium]
MRDLTTLYRPESVAVIGASATRGKIGNAVVRNIIDSGYGGDVYPVNPGSDVIEGLKCYPSVGDIPGQVDQAVICIPARLVAGAMRECGRAGVKSVVTISAGFREVGPEGAEMEREIAAIADEYGMNMMGPNCLGVMATHTPLNASFSEGFPLQGNIAFFSQSGALCIAIVDWGREQGLGFSKFISMGNKAQLDEADFIADAARDPDTRVILLYLESIENGEAFMKAAAEAVREKPVVVVKSGTSEAGARAASSHTGALAGTDAGFEAAFKQSGVLRARAMEEQFVKAVAFAREGVQPRGRRVAIVTNSGGPGVMAVDAIESGGLKLAAFGEETTERLRSSLASIASVQNPVDVTGQASDLDYRVALESCCADPEVDMLMTVLAPTAVLDSVAVARHILEVSRMYSEKPMVASFTGGASVEEATQMLRAERIPCFQFPEEAVHCLYTMIEYQEVRERLKRGRELSFSGDRTRVEEIIAAVRADGRRIMLGPEAMAAAEAYGISTVPSRLATSPAGAAECAAELGFPVVLKVASPDIIHKTDIGGVRLGLEDRDAVETAYEQIMEGARSGAEGARVYGVEVQKMFPPGQELIVGLSRNPEFGPLLMFGLGGIFVDLMKDVSFRLAAGLTDVQVSEMIRETKAHDLLCGYRGEAPKDLEAVKETVGRVAQLARDFDQIQELDINPFFAYEEGVSALDVKITLAGEEAGWCR